VNRGILVMAGFFFACILGYLGFLVFRTIHSARVASDTAAAYKRFVAEAPSAVDLPRVEPLTPAQLSYSVKSRDFIPGPPCQAHLIG
jgi:hypothetical protein